MMDDCNHIPTHTDGDGIFSGYLEDWHETVVFNHEDIDDGKVVAQGQKSGKYYLLDLDDFLCIAYAQLYN